MRFPNIAEVFEIILSWKSAENLNALKHCENYVSNVRLFIVIFRNSENIYYKSKKIKKYNKSILEPVSHYYCG